VPDWSPRPFVSYQGGHGSISGIEPAAGRSELHAVLAVADEAQDAVMEVSWAVWPVCPAHQLGAHAREDHGAAAWGCNADGGHVIAPIGRWGSGPR
jgi:hypothetical protein